MEFPGRLGVALYRLRMWMRDAPIAAIGPLFGFIGADIAIDLQRGQLSSVAIQLLITPILAMTISSAAQRDQSGPAGILLLALGAISVLGASVLLALGLGNNAGPVVVVGLRHLVVAAYAWAAIASEPPARRRFAFQPLPT